MPDKEFVSVTEAVICAHSLGIPCTHATMITWIKTNGLGHQALGRGSRYIVNNEKLKEFLRNGPK